jgi:uncharacterized protein
MGFDTLLFKGGEDGQLVKIALAENRIIVTRDTRLKERKLIFGGQVKALLLKTDNVLEQARIALTKLDLKSQMRPFSLCLKCNYSLTTVNIQAVQERVPPYVLRTQNNYMECACCKRVYWKGTHWAAMKLNLAQMNILINDQNHDKTN